MSISNQNQLSDLAVILMQQQGLLFTNTDEAEHCKLGLVQELGDITAHAQIFFVEGLQLLNQLNQPIIKATVQQLLAHPDSYEELQKIQQSAVLNEPKTQKLFYEAVNSFYDCGDTHREQCVTSVLLVLFPFASYPPVFEMAGLTGL